MKKLLLLLLGVLIALPSVAEDFAFTYEGQTLTYTILDEDAKTCQTKAGYSSKPGNSVSGNLIIPEVANGYTVVGIGTNGFYKCSGLTSVTIPESVTSVGSSAFSGCTGLTSVTIPASVTSIGSSAFYRCSGLTSVTIPKSVTSIGASAFSGCSGLTSVTIPKSVTSIGASAFSGCSGLTSVTIPKSVTSIGNYAFSGCSGLTSVTIPEGVMSIGNYAFEYCTSLETLYYNAENCQETSYSSPFPTTLKYIVIGKSVTTIPDYLFRYNRGLTSVTIPESVTSIGNSAFSDCTGLTSVTIPESVTSIGSSAFYGCTDLTSVTIPERVTYIGTSAFDGCSSLETLYYNAEKLGGTSSSPFPKTLKNVVIGENVKTIPIYVFYGNTDLTSVTIPEGVTSIGSYAFSGCTGLQRAAYPSTLSNPFGSKTYAFVYSPEQCITEGGEVYSRDKSTLYFAFSFADTYTVAPTVTAIADKAFYYCNELKSVVLSNGLKTIGRNSFEGCDALESVVSNVSPAPLIDPSSFAGLYDQAIVNIPMDVIGDYTNGYTNWTLFSNIRPQSVGSGLTVEDESGFAYQHIGDSNEVRIVAANNYATMTEAVIPATFTQIIPAENEGEEPAVKTLNVVEIAPAAFSGCTSLTAVVIPEGVRSIGSTAFKNCTSLSSVTFPKSLVTINSSAFEGCSELSAINLGNVETIGSAAFAGTKLTSVDVSSVRKIDDFAFAEIPTLTSFTAGADLAEIGFCAFMKNPKLTKVELQSTEGLAIGNYAFHSCSALTTVTLGDGVKTVGDYAFADNSKLRTVSVGKNVESIGNHAFDGAVISTLNLVKDGALRSIGASAFSGIRARGTLDLPDALEQIGDSAFINPRMYDAVILPANGKLTIGNEAFAHGQRLATVTFPEAISSVGNGAFCDNILTDVEVKSDNVGTEAFAMSNKLLTLKVDGRGTIGNRAFAELPLLETVEVDNVVLGDSAFHACPELKTVSMGDAVKTVGQYAFADCSKLSRVDFGLGLESLQMGSLYNTKVDSISFPSAAEPNPVIVVEDTKCPELRYLSLGNRTKETKGTLTFKKDAIVDLGSSVETIGILYVRYGIPSLTLPPSLTKVELNNYNGTKIDSLIIPFSSVSLSFSVKDRYSGYFKVNNAYIDRSFISTTYFECRDLTYGETQDAKITTGSSKIYASRNVHIGASVAELTTLSCGTGSLTFSEGVKKIGTIKVSGKDTESLRLPASLETLGTISHYYNYYPHEVIFADSNSPLTITGSIDKDKLESVYLGRDISGSYTFADAPNLSSLIVGDSVTTINPQMFKNCAALKSAIMSDNVSTIGEEAFYGCSGLDVLSISANVTTIGDNAYAECNNFERIVARGMVPAEGNAGFGREVEDNVPLYVPEAVVDDYFDSDLFYPFYTIESFNDNVVEDVIVEAVDEEKVDQEFTVGSQFKLSDLFKFIFKMWGQTPDGRKMVRRVKMRSEELTNNVRWFAPNPAIASVDQEGQVTINGEGEAEIWVYALDGSDCKAVIGINKVMLGDVNYDLTIDMTDVNYLKKHIQDPAEYDVKQNRADMNADGIMDITDVNIIKKQILNKTKSVSEND